MAHHHHAPSLFFEDYVTKDNFAESFLVLAGEAAHKAHLPSRIDEIGLVCQNVKTAATYLEKKYGMRPFFLGWGSPQKFTQNGKEIPFTTRVGFGFYKGVIIELAEPGLGSNIFGQTVTTGEQILINHLGFTARGPELLKKNGSQMVSYTENMKKAGLQKCVDAELNIMGLLAHLNIFEAMHETHGVELEFLDFRLLTATGIKMNYAAGIVSFIGWLQRTTGLRYYRLKEKQPLPPEK